MYNLQNYYFQEIFSMNFRFQHLVYFDLYLVTSLYKKGFSLSLHGSCSTSPSLGVLFALLNFPLYVFANMIYYNSRII